MSFWTPMTYSYAPSFPRGISPANSNLMNNQSIVTSSSQPDQFARMQAERYKNSGNEYRKAHYYTAAIQAYRAAISIDPTYTDAYYNLAQLMVLLGNIPSGIQLLSQLVLLDPEDYDARSLMGEYYQRLGNTQAAKQVYLEILQAKPNFDPARRELEYLQYLGQKQVNPSVADSLYKNQYNLVVSQARELLRQYFEEFHPNPYFLKVSQSIPIVFAPTQKIDESANLAEYDAYQNLVRIQPQILFSSPNVVAAYLSHELVHALDGDAQTSVREEQDGYLELAKFWTIYKGDTEEPNLDRALSLYQESPFLLEQEVRRVYTIRDNTLSEYSPGHGLPSRSTLTLSAQQYDQAMKSRSLDSVVRGYKTKIGLFA